MTTEELDALGELFRLLAEVDFEGVSPLYRRVASYVADDPRVLSLLLPAAPPDRLPHLLLAAVQYLLLGQGTDPLQEFEGKPSSAFAEWCVAHREEIERVVATRVIQTNEVGRCAGLIACLSDVAQRTDQPLAIIEAGASAGLNLRFDEYRYEFGDELDIGPRDSAVVLRPRVDGGQVPQLSMPSVAWRTGIDRRPIDVHDDDEMRWLRACIWPEQRWRFEPLERAVELARRDPPVVVRGDIVETLPRVVRDAPRDATLCIVHTAMIGYVANGAGFRRAIADAAADRPVWWVSGEPHGFVEYVIAPAPSPDPTAFLYGVVPIGVDGEQTRAVARAGSHGGWIEFFS